MKEIYLDNSATTRPYPEVLEMMNRVQDQFYGNPSAMHEKGIAAEKVITEARRQIARHLGCHEKEVVFTSGGTEANNQAIIGAVLRNRKRGKHLITVASEHPSVLNSYRYLEKEGFRVSYLPVDQSGSLDPELLISQVTAETILISVMHINNEIGTIMPLSTIGPAIKVKNPQTLLHVDAVQSYARLPLDPSGWQADLISGSSHKIHGPKGSGFLWIRTGTLLDPLLHGGGQERGLRSGTENTAAIAGFGLAAHLAGVNYAEKISALMSLKKAFLLALDNSSIDFASNGPTAENGAPHILNLAFPGIKAEILLHVLEQKKIYVSAGSACHARHPEPSHVLQAIGLKADLLDSSIRFSFSITNTMEEIITAAGVTADAVKHLASLSR